MLSVVASRWMQEALTAVHPGLVALFRKDTQVDR
jgi:hypothetical protein